MHITTMYNVYTTAKVCTKCLLTRKFSFCVVRTSINIFFPPKTYIHNRTHCPRVINVLISSKRVSRTVGMSMHIVLTKSFFIKILYPQKMIVQGVSLMVLYLGPGRLVRHDLEVCDLMLYVAVVHLNSEGRSTHQYVLGFLRYIQCHLLLTRGGYSSR